MPFIRAGALGVIVLFVALGTGMTLGALRLLSSGLADIVAGIPFGAAAGILGEEIRSREERRFHKAATKKLAGLEEANKRLQDMMIRESDVIEERERRDALLTRTESNSAYYLGVLSTSLPVMADSSPELPQHIRTLCSDLGLHFSEKDEEVFQAPLTKWGNAETVSELVLAKAENLKPALWCFFWLGNKVPWLRDQVEHARSTEEAFTEFEQVQTNPLLSLDPRYAHVVDQIVACLQAYRDGLPDEAREALKERVNRALGRIPPIYMQARSTRHVVKSTEWIWVKEGAMRFIGGYALLARNADAYEVIVNQEGKAFEAAAHISRDDEGWHCSAHPTAAEGEPCFEMQMVLDATDGGQPVTEARVAYVREDDPDVPLPPPPLVTGDETG